MKALVTGANGFVGSNLVRELVAGGHAVRALVRPGADLRALAGVPVEQAVGDVLEPASLAAASRGQEVVFHAAAVFAYSGVAAEPLRAVAVDGTRHVLEAAAAAGVRRVVVTSSSVALGSSTTTVPRDEACELPEEEPAPPYFHVKAAQEREAFEAGRELGVEVVAVLPTITVGPHDLKVVPSTAVLLDYLRDPLRTTFPGGCNVVHVRDVAAAHVLAAERGEPGQRYLAGSENLEWALLHRIVGELSGVGGPRLHAGHLSSLLAATTAEAWARLSGTRPLVTRDQARTVGRFYWYDHARLAALGWSPRPARRALAEAVAWLLRSPHMTRTLRLTLAPSPEVLAVLAEEDARAA
ncbi:MAG: NAD-dependent epimerase/dehydratase family protein [Anaeromyxobacter sp.]